jgi:hypothetical protein
MRTASSGEWGPSSKVRDQSSLTPPARRGRPREGAPGAPGGEPSEEAAGRGGGGIPAPPRMGQSARSRAKPPGEIRVTTSDGLRVNEMGAGPGRAGWHALCIHRRMATSTRFSAASPHPPLPPCGPILLVTGKRPSPSKWPPSTPGRAGSPGSSAIRAAKEVSISPSALINSFSSRPPLAGARRELV